MTGTRVPEPLGAIGIPNLKIGLKNLVPVPVGAPGIFDSDFTQAGPVPGSGRPESAEAKLQPFITNAQEVDTLIEVSQAGSARREGAMVTFREQLEANTEFRGWIPPTEIQAFTVAAYGTVDTFDLLQGAVIPSTQEVIVVAKRLSDGVPLARLWSPVTKEFGATVDILAGSGIASGNHASVVVLPGDELILAMVGVRGTIFSSKDKGATWQLYALEPLGVTLTLPAVFKRDRMAVTPNGEVVLFHETATANEVAQFASSDRGASWSEVETTTVLGKGIDVTALPDGTIGIAYGSTFARLASPFDPGSEAPTVAIVGGIERALWADFDGTLYLMIRDVSNGRFTLQRSKDSGTTWQTFSFFPWADAAAPASTVFLSNIQVVPKEGGCGLLTNFTMTGGAFDGSIGFLQLGGWSNVLGGLASAGELVLDRAAYGGDGTGTSGTWVAADLPVNMGFAQIGTAPTLVAASAGELEYATVAATGFSNKILGTQANITVIGELRRLAGGSLATTDGGFTVSLSDGVNSSNVELNFDGTGFRIRDVNAGTTLATVAVDITANNNITDNVLVKIQIISRTTIRVFFRRPIETNWTRVTLTTSTLSFIGIGITGLLEWGNVNSSSATFRWRQFHYVTGAIALQRVADVNRLIGKGMGGDPYPIPDIGKKLGGSKFAFLGLDAGPGVVGERYQIPVAFTFGVRNLFADIEASPDVGWRALDDTQQRLVFDLGRDTLIGKSIFAALLRVKQRLCTISTAVDGAGAFTVLGGFDSAADFGALAYTLSGDSARPTPGVVAASRYLFEGEAVGGSAVLGAGLGVAREIGECLAGHWTGTVRPELVLLGIDGTETVSDDLDIVMPDAIHVVHTAGIRARFIEFKFPAAPGNTTPNGFIGAGHLSMGRIQPLGQLHEWDWASETSENRDEEVSPYGTSRFRELGPPLTEVFKNYQSGLDMTDLRQAAPEDINYQAPVSDLAGLAALNDVWLLWRGIVQELKSGQTWCFDMPAVPQASDTTLSDRSLFTYGRIAGSVRADGVVGDEGFDELVRILAPSIQEIR